jgi:hypothetical protein
MKNNNSVILDVLICAARDCKSEYVGATETVLLSTHRFETKSKSSCAKVATLLADIVAARRIQGISVTIENLDVVVKQVKK